MVSDAPALADAARDGELWKLGYTLIGAPETMGDGVLRHHMLMPDGWLRNTYVFSILASE